VLFYSSVYDAILCRTYFKIRFTEYMIEKLDRETNIRDGYILVWCPGQNKKYLGLFSMDVVKGD
jgi:hypothetical protein